MWLFLKKTNDASESNDLSSLTMEDNKETITASPAPSPATSVKLPNGLEVQDLQIGVGAEARAGEVVFAHYKGTLENGTVFDESYSRGQPFAFILGAGQVIKGWDTGIIGMKVGGRRRLIVPPELGYGAVGQGPIPANSVLIFEVELIDVKTIEEVQKQ